MKRTDPQFKLRLPPHLKEKVERSADAASRTLSNEIIHRLEWSFQAEDRGSAGAVVGPQIPGDDLDARIMQALEKVTITDHTGHEWKLTDAVGYMLGRVAASK